MLLESVVSTAPKLLVAPRTPAGKGVGGYIFSISREPRNNNAKQPTSTKIDLRSMKLFSARGNGRRGRRRGRKMLFRHGVMTAATPRMAAAEAARGQPGSAHGPMHLQGLQ